MSARHRGFAWAVCSTLVLGLAGCGNGPGKVRGKVTHKGKAVVWGSVTVIGSDGVTRDGQIDVNGNYEIAQVPSGPIKIAVSSPDPNLVQRGRGKKDAAPRGAPKGGGLEDPREKFLAGKEQDTGPTPPPPGAWFAIPEKYGSAETSGLTGEVRGDTVIDIDLK